MGRSADVPRAHSDETADDVGCTILHVDMDAFFASVEIRRRPELRGKPVIVGGGVRGVVAAVSYAARRYGVRSAMPIGQALRLCPHATVIPPDRAAYTEASAQVMAILRDVTPHVEPLSLDEAFLDISGVQRLLGSSRAVAEMIRGRVLESQQLTCSVGIATTKFVAKLASARCKPDGVLVVPADGVLDFLHPLPVTVLWGVGARTAAPLHRLGIRSISDLANTPLDTLQRAIGVAAASHLHELSWGRDPRGVSDREPERSISSDRTSDTDLTRRDEVHTELLRLASDVSARVRSRGLMARTVGIKIRYADFTTITRVRTLPGWVDSTDEIHAAAIELFDNLKLDRPRIRLVGVKCENLREAAATAQQLSLDLDGFLASYGKATAPAPVPDGAVEGRGMSARRSSDRSSTDRSAVTPTTVATRSSTPSVEPPDRRTTAEMRSRSDRVVDAARERFGANALQRGSLLRAPPGGPTSQPDRDGE